jgi:hypothetical protein
VLFYAEYPVNSMGQVISPYTSDHSTTVLTGLGIASSVGATNFVPAGYNGAGQFKVASYSGNTFYSVPLTSDGSGGYTLGSATLTATLNTCASTCGPEGFVYVPQGSPVFTGQNLLMAEYGSGTIGVYSIDSNGDPIPQRGMTS